MDTPDEVPWMLGAMMTLLPWAQSEAPAGSVKPEEEEEEEEGAAVDPPGDERQTQKGWRIKGATEES